MGALTYTAYNPRYDITVLNVKSAVAKLEDLGIPYKRPEDYYAEMIKTDDHMLKLKVLAIREFFCNLY